MRNRAEERIKALANFLGISTEELSKLVQMPKEDTYSDYEKHAFRVNNVDFLVCTEEEAYRVVSEDIENLIGDIGVEMFFCDDTLNVEDYLEEDIDENCEISSEMIDYDKLAKDVVQQDGFVKSLNRCEQEFKEGEFYIFPQNDYKTLIEELVEDDIEIGD